MKKLAALAVAAALVPTVAFAHEHHIFEINGLRYEFTVGSINEPVVVDDKSGVELHIQKVGAVAGHESHHAAASAEGAVAGLEETLQVELQSGNDRRTLALAPTWSAPGFYTATFYPTSASELRYRVFGTIDDIPVDLLFTCKPRHDMEGVETDTTRTELSPGVIRVEKRGAFGCPMEKAALGFPAASASVYDVKNTADLSLILGGIGVALALLALGLVWRRSS